jgi:hypothetical protein
MRQRYPGVGIAVVYIDDSISDVNVERVIHRTIADCRREFGLAFARKTVREYSGGALIPLDLVKVVFLITRPRNTSDEDVGQKRHEPCGGKVAYAFDAARLFSDESIVKLCQSSSRMDCGWHSEKTGAAGSEFVLDILDSSDGGERRRD